MKLNDPPQSKAIDIIFCDGMDVVIGQPEQSFADIIYNQPDGILIDTMYEIEYPIEDAFGSLCCEIF